MSWRDRRTRAFASRRFAVTAWLIGCSLSVLLSACARGSRADLPTPFALQDRISFGIFDLQVMRWEEVPQSHPPVSSLNAPEGERAVAVFVYWRGLADYRPEDRQVFVESFLRGRTRVVDSEGYAYDAITAMTKDIYTFLPGGGPTQELVVIYHIWIESEGLALMIEHPDPQEGGFRVAAVPLD